MSNPNRIDPIFYKEESWKDGYGNELPAGWYFWDEIWQHAHGPFKTRELASGALTKYAESL